MYIEKNKFYYRINIFSTYDVYPFIKQGEQTLDIEPDNDARVAPLKRQ